MVLLIIFISIFHCRHKETVITSLSAWNPDLDPKDTAIFENMLKDQVQKANNEISMYNKVNSNAEFENDVEKATKNALFQYEEMLLDPYIAKEKVDNMKKAYEAYSNAKKNIDLVKKSLQKANEEKYNGDVLIAELLKGQY